MEKVKEKMNALRSEIEDSQKKVEDLSTQVKGLEQDNLTKDQEIASLIHRNSLLDAEVEKLELSLKQAKTDAEFGAENTSTVESLQRKLQLLEEEAEEADKNLRETNEKLRLTDVKAEHYERKVATVEAERDKWEKKYEEVYLKYKAAQEELEVFATDLAGI